MAGSMLVADIGVAAAQNRESFENRQSYRNDWRGSRHHYRGDRHYSGDRHYRGDRHWRGDRRYWRGRDRGDALAAGAAGLVTGAIIGGIVANQPSSRRVIRSGGSSHVQWCYDRYRSYRASDNTFQPYNGPRRQCYSPYS
ncbi:BA14K family protein [Tianweitania sediminis]|uniref:Lectin-like protein BA14k n=2 Tax=Tianweitania sediminis TaxID=1502156 RepID=A0A8J7ULD7_9HYPH|nr:BA14K family protein [Tianweitania sediminis]